MPKPLRAQLTVHEVEELKLAAFLGCLFLPTALAQLVPSLAPILTSLPQQLCSALPVLARLTDDYKLKTRLLARLAASPIPELGTMAPSVFARLRTALFNLDPTPPVDDTIFAYTDASCTRTATGLGVVIYKDGIASEYSKTLFACMASWHGELAAIQWCLELLQACTQRRIALCTDADSVITWLVGARCTKQPACMQVTTVREAMRAFAHLRIVKVPGHAGVWYNERADSLARACTKLVTVPTKRPCNAS